MTDEIGFIGLGALGAPMAANLLARGHKLAVHNRTRAKAEPLAAAGARIAASPADAVSPGGVVFSVLWDADATLAMVAADGFLDRLGAGGVHVGMQTGAPDAARRLAELHAAHGATYVEAPVFGRPEAAAARQLWIPLAGTPAAKDRIRPLLADLGAQGVFEFGEQVGAATMVKLAGNFLIINAARAFAEALDIAGKGGADRKAVADMLIQTLFNAPIYQAYGRRLAEGGAAFGPSLIPAKDLRLFEDVAKAVDSPAPIAHLLRRWSSRSQTEEVGRVTYPQSHSQDVGVCGILSTRCSGGP
jgi:3-hydroxyisobutyrate dehydrogenase-like beta-hydroxyacid dehydrogenase